MGREPTRSCIQGKIRGTEDGLDLDNASANAIFISVTPLCTAEDSMKPSVQRHSELSSRDNLGLRDLNKHTTLRSQTQGWVNGQYHSQGEPTGGERQGNTLYPVFRVMKLPGFSDTTLLSPSKLTWSRMSVQPSLEDNMSEARGMSAGTMSGRLHPLR